MPEHGLHGKDSDSPEAGAATPLKREPGQPRNVTKYAVEGSRMVLIVTQGKQTITGRKELWKLLEISPGFRERNEWPNGLRILRPVALAKPRRRRHWR